MVHTYSNKMKGVCIMAVDFQSSKTKENLMKAFAGESQARNRYTIAAEMARKHHLYAVSQIFLFTADQEKAHAQRYYELLREATGKTIEICGGFPVDTYDSLTEILTAAEHNETEEYKDVYQSFGNQAKEEGFLEAASTFFQIAEVEKIHAKRFGTIKELLENNTYFELAEEGAWMCLNCGHIFRGTKVPEICPLCRHEKGYFIPLSIAPYTDSGIVPC